MAGLSCRVGVMNKIQLHIRNWMNRTQTSQQALSLQAGRAISYVSNVMIGKNSSDAAVTVLDEIVHFPPGIVRGMKLHKRKKNAITQREMTALIWAWKPPKEKRV